MLAVLDACRWLYNQFLEERKTLWETKHESTTLYKQQAGMVRLTKQNPSLECVYSQSRQNVAVRVDLAFKAFFRRCRIGEKPGYPRFRGKGWYDSFAYPQNNGAFKLVENDTRIYLSKIGCVKIECHRPLRGTPKTCTVKITPTGKWYVYISCADVAKVQVKPSNLEVGIDVGLKTFATLSDGTTIENPRFFKQSEKALAKVQRRLIRQDKVTKQRAKAKMVVAKVYERMTNRREDFAHRQSKRIVDKYGTICVEDLDIKGMLTGGSEVRMAKGIQDVAWRSFLCKTAYKAESAGRPFQKVNPAYTSQDCSGCGNRQTMKLSDRTYHCPACGLSLDRDLNAAKNILAVGLHSLANRKVA
jgi:putative transposase